MTRQKKSRKVGQIGIRKQETRPADKKESGRKKTHKGQKSGTRNSLVDGKVSGPGNSSGSGQKLNKKLGSKVKIDLLPSKKAVKAAPEVINGVPGVKLEKVQPVTLTPAQEFAELETNELLIELAERIEAGELLTGKDAKYFNRNMNRYDELAEKLGLVDDVDDEDEYDEEEYIDPLESLGGDEWSDLMDKDK